MKTWQMGWLLTSILAAASLFAYAKDSQRQTLNLNADKISSLRVEAGAGDLSIRGDKSVDEITVLANVIGEDLEPEDYVLTLEQRGGNAYLIAKILKRNYSNYNSRAYIDLDVVVPQTLSLRVVDGSGDTRIAEIANDVDVRDGSGDMEIKTISGTLKVDDGSGDLFIATINGDTQIEDGSGDIELVTVVGSVEIDDGSGGIEVETVNGDVEIDDGSGEIRVNSVTGLVSVDDGSGSIKIDDVGDFQLLDDGSGSVRTSGVGKK